MPASKSGGYDLQIVDGVLTRDGGKKPATLATVIDALRDQYTEANIVCSPSLADLQVADLKIRSGLLADELEAIRIASGGNFIVKGPSEPSLPIDPNTGMAVAGKMNLNAGLFILQELPSESADRVVEAFNIGPYLNWLRKNGGDPTQNEKALPELRTIIEETVSSLRGNQVHAADIPEVRFHRGASLLVVIGRRQSVEVARRIVSALPEMPAFGAYGPPTDSRVAEETRRRGAEQRGLAEDAFRRRYGLAPAEGKPAPDAVDPAKPRPDDAVRNRYGLPPANPKPPQPESSPAEPGPQR